MLVVSECVGNGGGTGGEKAVVVVFLLLAAKKGQWPLVSRNRMARKAATTRSQ